MIAADIDQIDIVALHPRDDRGEILVALVVGFEHLFGEAGLVERLLGLVGEALAVGGLVVEDGDVLALVSFSDVVSGNQALLLLPDWVQWCARRTELAPEFADRALSADPSYSMARLLQELFISGLPPWSVPLDITVTNTTCAANTLRSWFTMRWQSRNR